MRTQSTKRESGARCEAPLQNPKLRQRLVAYSAIAGSTAAGLLAASQPAAASMVYTSTSQGFGQPRGDIFIDLNHDGIVDFRVIWSNSSTGMSSAAIWGGKAGNLIAASGRNVFVLPGAARLPYGASIKSPFRSDAALIGCYNFVGTCFGNWPGQGSGFVGLEFKINGEIHYGWAEFRVQNSVPIRGFLTGYAYETVPLKPIKAGQRTDEDAVSSQVRPRPPATLGLLALGAPGIEIWRRRQQEWAGITEQLIR